MTLIERLRSVDDQYCASAADAIEALQGEVDFRDDGLKAAQNLIDALQAERERNLDSIRVNNEVISKKNAEIDALAAKLATLEADAERYRWLREQHWTDNTMSVVSDPKKNVQLGTFMNSGVSLDAAIDAAKGGQQ